MQRTPGKDVPQRIDFSLENDDKENFQIDFLGFKGFC